MKKSYKSGNNGAASHYNFDKNPIDSTVKVFKATDIDKENAKPIAIIATPQAKVTTSDMAINANISIEKDNRKHSLEMAIQNGKVKTIEEAAAMLIVTPTTVLKYLREMDMKLPYEKSL